MANEKEITRTDIMTDKRGFKYYIEGESYSSMSKRIKKKFIFALVIEAIILGFVVYINVTGRIPFYGNFTNEIYKSQVQHYFDVRGTGEKVDPNLTYDESNPYKLYEDEQ